MKKSKGILRIETWLAKIGYTLKNQGCGFYYIFDDEGDATDWYLFGGDKDTRLSIDPVKSFQASCSFYLKDITIKSIKDKRTDQDRCISFCAKGSNSVFIQFYKRGK